VLAWLARKEHSLVTFLRETDKERAEDADLVAAALARPLERAERRALLISQADGQDVRDTALGAALERRGFQPTARGLMKRGARNLDQDQGLQNEELNDDDDS
jgi:hypothetical protein